MNGEDLNSIPESDGQNGVFQPIMVNCSKWNDSIWASPPTPNQDVVVTDLSNNNADDDSSLYTNTDTTTDQFSFDPNLDLLQQIISKVVTENDLPLTDPNSNKPLIDNMDNASNLQILNQLILQNIIQIGYQGNNVISDSLSDGTTYDTTNAITPDEINSGNAIHPDATTIGTITLDALSPNGVASNDMSSTISDDPASTPISIASSTEAEIDPTADSVPEFVQPSSITNIEDQFLPPDNDNAFQCEFCLITFNGMAELEFHYLTHTDMGPFSCQFCDWKFHSNEALQKHLQYHSNGKVPMCEICGFRFSDLTELKSHLAVHSEKIIIPDTLDDVPMNLLQQCNIYTCESCEQHFTTLKTLRKHERYDHKTKRKPFPCKYCEKSFTQKYKLNSHMKDHENDKPHTCKICSKGFSSKSNLRTHQMTHAINKPFICELCPKGFARKISLTAHLLIHTGETPYKCDVCGKGFRVKNHLNSHKLIHSTDKPFECDKCFKKFKRDDHLKKHLITHTDDKPFACDICSKTFNRKHNLKIHRAAHFRNNENNAAGQLYDNSPHESLDDYNTDVDFWEFSNGTLNCYKNPLELEESFYNINEMIYHDD